VRPINNGTVELIPIASGLVGGDVVEYGSVAVYSCDDDFSLRGRSEVACGDGGRWEAEPPR
jgi:hypothetical protein